MSNLVLERPPSSWPTDYVLRQGDLGSEVKIVYCDGRGAGIFGRGVRPGIHIFILHIFGNTNATPQAFANSMQGSSATLSETSFYSARNSPWGMPTILQALPLDRIGAGSVAGCAYGITCESSPEPNTAADHFPWPPDVIEMMSRYYAFLVKNPKGWPKLDLRHRICSDQSPRAEQGGMGWHTLFGDVSVDLGGTSRWTKNVRSCPGKGTDGRRGYEPNTPNYPGITYSANVPGNVRNIFNRAGELLAPPPDPFPSQGAEMIYIAKPTGSWWPANYDPAWFVLFDSGAVRRAVGADVAYAASKNLPTLPITSPDHYKELHHASGTTYVPLP